MHTENRPKTHEAAGCCSLKNSKSFSLTTGLSVSENKGARNRVLGLVHGA